MTVDDQPRDLGTATYIELRRLAAARMRGSQGVTLQPTALVHEAWAKVGGTSGALERKHFMALAARAMRQVIIDHARAKQADKRGGKQVQVSLVDGMLAASGGVIDAIALDAALTRLAELSERQAKVVEMRFFGGMSVPEVAAALEVSTATVEREWRSSRAWLHAHLAGG